MSSSKKHVSIGRDAERVRSQGMTGTLRFFAQRIAASSGEKSVGYGEVNLRRSRPGMGSRRRSSSAAEFKSNWSGPDDRVKEELDEREKAINVRRAVKMEKVSCLGTSFLRNLG